MDAHEKADRLAQEFGKDAKKVVIFKSEGEAQVKMDLKREIPTGELIERFRKAMGEK